jgi:hypothetical protein
MDVIGHETPCQEGNTVPVSKPGKELQVDSPIRIRLEYVHRPYAALDDVMGQSR